MSKATWQDTAVYRRLLAKLKKDGVGGGIPGFQAATADELTAVREGLSPSGLLAENGRTFLAVGEGPSRDGTAVSRLESGALQPGQTGRTQVQSYSELDDPGLESEYRYADSDVEVMGSIPGRGYSQALIYGSMDDQITYGQVTINSALEADSSMSALATLDTHVGQDAQTARVLAQAAGRAMAALEVNHEGSVNTATLTLDGDICGIYVNSANATAHVEADANGAFLDLDSPGSAVYLKSPNGTRYKLTVTNNGTLSITSA